MDRSRLLDDLALLSLCAGSLVMLLDVHASDEDLIHLRICADDLALCAFILA